MTSIDAPTPHYPGLLDLSGKAFIVLGAGQGIGGEVCHAITQCGGEVLCVDLKPEIAERTAGVVGGEWISADVTSRPDMEAVFARADVVFGARLSGVVDVVGVTLPSPLPDYDDETIDRQFDLVVRHAILAIQMAAPRLAANGGGSITLVGSLAGLMSTRKVALYGVAKSALHSLAANAATELGPQGIRVNAVAPGRIRNSGTIFPDPALWASIERAIPLGRTGVPQDIASVILFLCSDLGRYVTGNVIAADGGVHRVSALPSSLA
jgi:3-oxoacyl-[acyl-carrier protein] reductase